MQAIPMSYRFGRAFFTAALLIGAFLASALWAGRAAARPPFPWLDAFLAAMQEADDQNQDDEDNDDEDQNEEQSDLDEGTSLGESGGWIGASFAEFGEVGAATTVVEAPITAVSSNLLGLRQRGGSGAHQNAAVRAPARTSVASDIRALSVNTRMVPWNRGVTQLTEGAGAGASFFDSDLLATVAVRAAQTLNTFNIINVLQRCGDGCTQNAAIDADALSVAMQNVEAHAINAMALDGGFVPRAASGSAFSDFGIAGVAQTLIDAPQMIVTGNAINLLQQGGSGAIQNAAINASAETFAEQSIQGLSANVLEILSQLP